MGALMLMSILTDQAVYLIAYAPGAAHLAFFETEDIESELEAFLGN